MYMNSLIHIPIRSHNGRVGGVRLELETFLHNLHFNTDKIFPKNWQVNWEDAPLPYKLYRGLPVIPLTADTPFFQKEQEERVKPNLLELGHFLWYVYGLSQYSQSVIQDGKQYNKTTTLQTYRRFVPSGGALYPNELYVYVKLADLSEGIYHYDVAHHRLVLLREGNFDNYLSRSLGNSCDFSDCFGTVFISTMFWKNFYKYNHFSYRLQCLDAGVLIGQTLEVAERAGFSTRVCYQFLDRPINHLLGLSEQDESVYAVIPLSIEPTIKWSHRVENKEESVFAGELCREVPTVKHVIYNRSKKVLDYPLLKKMNEASFFETKESFIKNIKENHFDGFPSMEMILLPFNNDFTYDFASTCRKRFSPDSDFIQGNVSLSEITTLLYETAHFTSYQNDLEVGNGNAEPKVLMFGCFSNVERVQDGAYSYDKKTHSLQRIASGDFRGYLQKGLTMENVNHFQIPLCLHVVGNKDHHKNELGYRGYRIQQMEAGIVVQRLLLAATALGMGGHPLLGFDSIACDELYQIDSKGKTTLIQIPVGPYRPRAWLKGTLHC